MISENEKVRALAKVGTLARNLPPSPFLLVKINIHNKDAYLLYYLVPSRHVIFRSFLRYLRNIGNTAWVLPVLPIPLVSLLPDWYPSPFITGSARCDSNVLWTVYLTAVVAFLRTIMWHLFKCVATCLCAKISIWHYLMVDKVWDEGWFACALFVDIVPWTQVSFMWIMLWSSNGFLSWYW